MHGFLAFFGPKATLPTVVLMFLIVPVAIWHHVHWIILVVKSFREEESEETPKE